MVKKADMVGISLVNTQLQNSATADKPQEQVGIFSSLTATAPMGTRVSLPTSA